MHNCKTKRKTLGHESWRRLVNGNSYVICEYGNNWNTVLNMFIPSEMYSSVILDESARNLTKDAYCATQGFASSQFLCLKPLFKGGCSQSKRQRDRARWGACAHKMRPGRFARGNKQNMKNVLEKCSWAICAGVGLALYRRTKQAGPTDRLTPLKFFANPWTPKGLTPKTNEVHALDKILTDDDQQQRRMPN